MHPLSVRLRPLVDYVHVSAVESYSNFLFSLSARFYRDLLCMGFVSRVWREVSLPLLMEEIRFGDRGEALVDLLTKREGLRPWREADAMQS